MCTVLVQAPAPDVSEGAVPPGLQGGWGPDGQGLQGEPGRLHKQVVLPVGGGGGDLGLKLCGQITSLAIEDELCYQQRNVVFVFLVRYFCQFGATVCTAKLYCKCIMNKPYS